MEAGMEIITSDGRRVGYVGSPAACEVAIQLARSAHTIPLDWVSRIEREVLLRKTYRQVAEKWSAEPGPTIIEGGRRTA